MTCRLCIIAHLLSWLFLYSVLSLALANDWSDVEPPTNVHTVEPPAQPLAPAGYGAVDPQTGQYWAPAGPGFVNPTTGQYAPGYPMGDQGGTDDHADRR